MRLRRDHGVYGRAVSPRAERVELTAKWMRDQCDADCALGASDLCVNPHCVNKEWDNMPEMTKFESRRHHDDFCAGPSLRPAQPRQCRQFSAPIVQGFEESL